MVTMVGKKQNPPTAGLVVIGNEILTGKTEDTNSHYLCRELNFLGVEMKRITSVPDEPEPIGEVVREFSESYTWVFTSGGIGPTHDDITVESIARGFGVETEVNPSLEKAIREHYGEKLTRDHLKMALVPVGAELEDIPGKFFWQVRFRNIFIKRFQ